MSGQVRMLHEARGGRINRTEYGDDVPQYRKVLDLVALLYVAAVPWDILPIAFGRTITAPIAAVLICAWVVDGLRAPQPIVLPRSAGPLLYLVGLWVLCTLAWASDFAQGLATAQTYLVQLPLVVILANVLPRLWRRALVVLGISAGFLAASVLLRPADAMRAGRAAISGVDENTTAMVLVVGFAALTFCLSVNIGKRRTLWLTVPLVLTGLAVLRTGSRTGAIAMAAVVGVALWFAVRDGRVSSGSASRTVGLAAVAASTVVWANSRGLIPQRVVELIGLRAPGGRSALDDTGRGAAISAFRRSFDSWWAFGVGIGNDAAYLEKTEGMYINAHSLLWKTWVETGLIGTVLLGSILVVAVVHGRRCASPRAVALLAVPIFAYALTLGGASTSAFWFVICFAMTPGGHVPGALGSAPASRPD